MKFTNLQFALFASTLSSATAAGGGNCKNVCNAAITPHWGNCLIDECTQMGTAPCLTSDTESAQVACVCPSECQGCVDDVYSACGGCTDKTGYDWDRDFQETYKLAAEAMGCSGAARYGVLASTVLLSAVAAFTLS